MNIALYKQMFISQETADMESEVFGSRLLAISGTTETYVLSLELG
jgi:hypothetical protein